MNLCIQLDYLDELLPNPLCELEYTKDYELLIAIVLSAQTTDKKVNKVTRVLFNKYSNSFLAFICWAKSIFRLFCFRRHI